MLLSWLTTRLDEQDFAPVGTLKWDLRLGSIDSALLDHDIFFFASVFHIFATNVVFSPDSLSFFASLNVLFSNRAGASRHLDFDEQS